MPQPPPLSQACQPCRQSCPLQVYNSRLFVVDDLTLGAFNREYPGCEAILCGCNAGMRNIFMSVLDRDTGALRSNPSLPSFRFPVTECAAPPTQIRRPILFGQLVPVADAVWKGLAEEIGMGIAAAFAEANAAGGLGGRQFHVISHPYTDDASAAASALGHRYPVVGLLGSVGPQKPDANLSSAIPAIATFDTTAYSETPLFRVCHVRVP